MSSIVYWVLAIFLFGLMIVMHELGHFWAARLTGIGVAEFAVGMGPKLWSRKSASGVVYALRAFPFGGYCRFYADDEDQIPDRADAYSKQKIWKRAVVSLGGPFMNLIVALVVIFILLVTNVYISVEPVIDRLMPGLPAEYAGFLPGDRIIRVNGVDTATVEEISGAITKDDETEITFVVERNGEQVTLFAKPQWVESEKANMIGIYYQQVQVHLGVWPAMQNAVIMTGRMSRMLLDVFIDLIRGKEDVSNLSGPIGTVVAIKEQTEEYGASGFLNFAALLSVNLAVFNLLPVPGLDGSKLIFLSIEKIRGKRMDPNKEGFVLLLGFGLLLVVMVLVMYQDIMRLL